MIVHPLRRDAAPSLSLPVLVLAAALTFPAGAAPNAAIDVGAALEHAAADLAAGRAEAAVTAYRQLVARAPGLLDAHRGLAEALAAAGRADEAAAHLAGLGERLLAAGRHADAAAVLGRATELRPSSAPLHALHGRALALDQRSAAAAPALARAVALGDRDPATRLYLAAALWEAGDPAAAEPLLRELAAGTGAVATTAAHRLGRLLTWRGEPAAALPWLERAAADRPGAPDVLLDRARALAAAGRHDAAAAAFEELTLVAPDLHAAWYGLGRALLARGEREAAARALDRHAALYAAEQERTRRAGRARATLDRGWQLLGDGDTDAAIAHFASLHTSAESLAGMAAGHRAAGRPAEAVALLERALALDPGRHDLALLLDDARRAAETTPDPPP